MASYSRFVAALAIMVFFCTSAAAGPRVVGPVTALSCEEQRAALVTGGTTQQAFGAPFLLGGLGSALSGALVAGSDDFDSTDTNAPIITATVGVLLAITGIALLVAGRSNVRDGVLLLCDDGVAVHQTETIPQPVPPRRTPPSPAPPTPPAPPVSDAPTNP